MLNDPGRINAFTDQLVLDHQAIGNDSMCQTKGKAFSGLLHGSAKPLCFTFRGNACSHLAQCGSSHSEDVCVETVCMHNVYLIVFQITPQAPKLSDKIAIIKTSQRVFADLSEAE